MAAHQRHAVHAKAFREITRLYHVGDEQVCVAEFVGDVPDRHLGADEAARMDHRPQFCLLGDTEGQRVLGMGMNDRHDIRPRREDRRMNETLKIETAVILAYGLTIEVKLEDVFGTDQLRGQRAGNQEAVGVVRVTDADMTVGVDDLLPGEDAIGDHEILDQGVEIAHRVHPSFYSSPSAALRRSAAARNSALIRCGVAGSRVTAPGMPVASSIAAAMTAPTPFMPPSPTLLMPSGLSGLGASSVTSTSTAGVSRTVGSR